MLVNLVKKIILCLPLFLSGCSHYDTGIGYKTSGLDSDQKKIIENDLFWLYGLKSKIDNALLVHMMEDFGVLQKEDDDCVRGQIACTKLFYPSTIFLTDGFFKMTKSMRVSTLFHENAHHYYRYYYHENCADAGQEPNYNCDIKMESAYGVEVLFYQVLSRLFPDREDYKTELNLVSRFLKK